MAQIDSRTTQVNDYTDDDILVIKKKVAEVAENKQVSIAYGSDDMVDVLDNIDNNTVPTPSGTLSITSNNTYDVTNYASADVNVVPSLQNKSVTITSNTTTTITKDVGYDGLNEVEVTTNVQPNLESISATITENGTQVFTPSVGYDGLSAVEVVTDVQSGGSSLEKYYVTQVINGNNCELLITTTNPGSADELLVGQYIIGTDCKLYLMEE